MQQMARLAMKSSSGNQLVPPFTVFHTPPPTLPTHIALGVVGWIRMDRTRPPMFPGPSHLQPEDSVPGTRGLMAPPCLEVGEFWPRILCHGFGLYGMSFFCAAALIHASAGIC